MWTDGLYQYYDGYQCLAPWAHERLERETHEAVFGGSFGTTYDLCAMVLLIFAMCVVVNILLSGSSADEERHD